MKVVKLDELELSSTTINKLSVFKDDSGNIIILPQLWLIHIYNTGLVTRYVRQSKRSSGLSQNVYEQHEEVWTLTQEPVADQTIDAYVHKVFHFLKYIEDESKKLNIENFSIHHSELVTTKFLNHYFNDVLPYRLNSVASLELNKAAVMAYYDFLSYLELIPRVESFIYRKTRAKVNTGDHRQLKIRYISRHIRNELLMNCSSMRDRLIIRMGFEVGLRAEECTGLRLTPSIAKSHKHPGIDDLIFEMEQQPNQRQFTYMLSGLYTKGGKSRYIYFDRSLLESIKDYRDRERNLNQGSEIKTDSLFVRTDNGCIGKPISSHHATKVFHKIKNKVNGINKASSYHDLRHTFATELYHSEQFDERGYETRSENTALIKVQQRLGHASLESTLIYVHLRQQLIALEETNDNI